MRLAVLLLGYSEPDLAETLPMLCTSAPNGRKVSRLASLQASHAAPVRRGFFLSPWNHWPYSGMTETVTSTI